MKPGLIIAFAFLPFSLSSHFRGASMSWAPARNNTIKISFRITWTSSTASCNEYSYGTESMKCLSGCSGTIGSLRYVCTDYKAGEWSSGGNFFYYKPSTNQFEFGFSGNSWVSLVTGGSAWYLRATVDLTRRNDTGRINSSPSVDTPPILYWQRGCAHSYTLHVSDVDGDVIKCRRAVGSECGGVCSSFTALTINESACTISYTGSPSAGFYAVALQIEDFASKRSATPFSSVPLQFLVNMFSDTGCSNQSEFVYPTPETDKQYRLDIYDTVRFTIKARGLNNFQRVITMSDMNIWRSTEEKLKDAFLHYIAMNVTWTSGLSDAGLVHKLCFYARDIIGVTSNTRCVFIQVLDIDNCELNPCKNRGSCVDGINSYSCDCIVGYTGENCSINIDDCNSNLCQNGGTCVDGLNDFTCSCAPGYEGKLCSSDVDECDSNPCQNGGSCTDQVNGYMCTCEPGYSGMICENNVDECNSSPCQNGASCIDKVNGYSCTCEPGFTGITCAINKNECLSFPCENNGTCKDMINGYDCLCAPGYSGINCQMDIDECLSSPCHNKGNCTDFINEYKCTCLEGYSGVDCTTDLNECLSNPCLYGGSCEDRINGYVCTCMVGYAGLSCEADTKNLFANKEKMRTVIVGSSLGVIIIAVSVYAAYKTFTGKKQTDNVKSDRNTTERIQESTFENRTYKGIIEMSANENYINTIPRQTDIDTPEEDYVNTGSCKRVESNIYETVFDDTQ